MAHLRFTTARDLFEAFETAGDDIASPPSDAPSLDYLRSLMAAGDYQNAVGFCAYLLPRREAVWWACQSVRALGGLRNADEESSLQAAEAWVQEPEEDRRLAALDLGMRGDREAPATWAALAAAWTGGSMVPNEYNAAPAPPFATAKAARAAILIGVAYMPPEPRGQQLRACVESGIRLIGVDQAN